MSKVRDSELYFLILHWLRSTPCTSVDRLQRELTELNLLPTVHTYGDGESTRYEDLCRSFSHVPPSALREMLEDYVNAQADSSNQSTNGPVSLLEATGSMSYIPSVRAQITPSTLVFPPSSRTPSFFQKLFQRECAVTKRPHHLDDNLTSRVYERLEHVKTIRGHRKAVYCVAVDKDNKWLLTGADDGVIKVWDLDKGLLKITCRGHIGEITDLKINCTQQSFASSSNDTVVRIWSLQNGQIGHHLKELSGHTASITFLSWNPILTSALLSVSSDGTCRLWETERGIELIRLKPVGRLGHFYNARAFECTLDRALISQAEAEMPLDRTETDLGLSCCSFSPTGDMIAVSSSCGRCFLWDWPILKTDMASDQTWPDVGPQQEVMRHNQNVPLLMFSHFGHFLAAASVDGQIKAFSKAKGRDAHWTVRRSFSLPDPLPCPAFSRRRKTPPECNQITWSCDDQLLLAAYSCSVIMVWNITTGEEESILYGGHTDTPVHVLEAHPTDPKLCFSAGYDGMLILWDVINGRRIISLSSQDTHPGRWKWADPLQFVDGRFLSDGMGIVASDVAGQIHLFSVDPSKGPIKRTPYDQFFLYDYDKVVIGDNGDPVDIESGEPQHVHRSRFSMVDILDQPYDASLQEILITGRDLNKLPEPSGMPGSLLTLPPTMSAAIWQADELGLGPQATTSRASAALQRQIALMQESGEADDLADFLAPMQLDDQVEIEVVEIDDESEGSEYTPDDADPVSSPFATRRSERIQTRATEVLTEGVRRMPTRRYPGEVIEHRVEELEDVSVEATEYESEVDFVTSDEETSPSLDRMDSVEVQTGGNERLQSSIEEPGPSLRPRRSHRVLIDALTLEEDDEDEMVGSMQLSRAERYRRRSVTISNPNPADNHQFATCRSSESYRWLSRKELKAGGFYVPQVGDDAVFFPSLYHNFVEENPQLATQLSGHDLRFAEPCVVINVSYDIFRDGDLCPTIAKVRLKLMESDRDDIDITIPPPSFGHEEFLISRRVFTDAVNADWTIGSRCEVFYQGRTAHWWKGKVTEDRAAALLNDPWNCEGQYQRFLIGWQSLHSDPPVLLSPWEIYPEGHSTTKIYRSSSLSDDLSDRLVEAIKEARSSDGARYFRETLQASAAFDVPGDDSRRLFYNQVVALPISLKLIEERLGSRDYYVSLESFKHDLHLIVQNAHLFTGPESLVSTQAEGVERRVLRSIECLQCDSASAEAKFMDEILDEREGVETRLRRRRRERPGSPNEVVSGYQIRTRGMAKRDRQLDHDGLAERRTRRRRIV